MENRTVVVVPGGVSTMSNFTASDYLQLLANQRALASIGIVATLATLFLSGCGTTIRNHYTVTGNNNTFRCDSTAGQDKTVESSLGASISATAAASQQGAASNSGSSESNAMGVK